MVYPTKFMKFLLILRTIVIQQHIHVFGHDTAGPQCGEHRDAQRDYVFGAAARSAGGHRRERTP